MQCNMITHDVKKTDTFITKHSFGAQPASSTKAAAQACMQHALLMQYDEASNQVVFQRPLTLRLCRACHLQARLKQGDLRGTSRVMS